MPQTTLLRADGARQQMRGRNHYHHGDLRAALIIAGLDILERDGLDGLTLRRIGARVGVSHTAPKNHFRDRRALCTALASEGFWRLAKALKDASAGLPRSQRNLQRIARAYVGFAVTNPALFRLMFSEDQCDPGDPVLQEAERAAIDTLVSPGAKADRSETAACSGLPRNVWLLWSYMHGHATLALSGRAIPDTEAFAPGDDLAPLPGVRPIAEAH